MVAWRCRDVVTSHCPRLFSRGDERREGGGAGDRQTLLPALHLSAVT